MRFCRQILVTCCLLLCCQILLAQNPYYISINKSSGIPSNSIYKIFQDSKGFIWIANEEGLTRYDGVTFKTYTSSKQTSKSGSEIREDKYGRIWYQNFDGYVYYVENDSLKALPQNTPLGFYPYGIVGDVIFVVQQDGVEMKDIKTLQTIKTLSLNLSELGATSCGRSHYYLTVIDSLYVIDVNGNIKIIKTGRLGYGVEYDEDLLLIDRENRYNFCYRFEAGVFRKFIDIKGIPYIQNLSKQGENYLFCTAVGVWCFDAHGKSIDNGKPILADKNTSCIYVDREHNYWVGTLDEGLIFIPDFKTKVVSPNLKPDKLLVHDNKIIFTTTSGDIYRYTPADNTTNLLYKEDIRHTVNAFCYDASRQYYLAAGQILRIYDKNFSLVKKHTYAVKSIAQIDGKYLATAITGGLGLLIYGDGPSAWDSIYLAKQKLNNALANMAAGMRARHTVYNSNLNIIYYAANSGLFYATNREVKEIRFQNQPIRAVSLNYMNDKVFIATIDNRLLCIEGVEHIREIFPNQKNIHFYKARIVNGVLLYITNKGVFKFDTAKEQLNLLDIVAGIRGEEINDIEVCNGQYYIATDKGLLVTQGSYYDSAAPLLRINHVTVNGISHTHSKDHEYNYRQNNVEIEYSILYFKNSGKYPLYYRINSSRWRLAEAGARSLQLASLSPGNYTVSFCLGEPQQPVSQVQQVQFSIGKPYWLQWWFFCLCALAAGAVIVIHNRWQTGILKKKNILLEEKMELEKNLQKSILTSIRSQMNPHFFYNALYTIQSFIFSDDKRNASTYLVKLSKLTRMILEMTEMDSITLEKEKAALELYLELEKIRFDDDFFFELKSDSNVDTELIKIPPMIIQPYVENAIKHGLLHKTGAKKLTVEFVRVNGTICITIDDNGIGRKKAAIIKEARNEPHNSFSTNANNKRIEILNRGKSKNIGVVYIDKKDENNEPSGTTVIVSIPINQFT